MVESPYWRLEGSVGSQHPGQGLRENLLHLPEGRLAIGQAEGVLEIALENPLLRVLLQGLSHCVEDGLASPPHTDPQLVGCEELCSSVSQACGDELGGEAAEQVSHGDRPQTPVRG